MCLDSSVDHSAQVEAPTLVELSSVYLVLSSLYLYFPDPASVEAAGELAGSEIESGVASTEERGTPPSTV